MTAQDLKNSILQLAVEGKLLKGGSLPLATAGKPSSATPSAGTPRNAPSDPKTGAELLEQIKAEKARLIAEGKIKKDTTKAGASGRALAEITEDEIPFDIPESWCWCRLGEICFDIKRGKSPKYSEKSNYLAFAQKCNVKTGGINLEIALYLDESTISRYSNTDCLVQGDVVINSTGGGTMGRVGYFECEIPKGIKGIYPDSHVTTIRTVGFMEQKFVFYFLKTKQKELESLGEGSTNQTELKPYTLQNLLLPLPPLAEQKAIVAKIEELLPYIQKYDAAHTKLEEFNKKFPVEMQKSILQQAIMGKLTEDWRNEQASLAKTNSACQVDDRSSAKDLLKKIKAQKARLIAEGKIKKDTTKAGASGRALAEITEDEIPFDIPESWCWCRLGEICFDIKRGKSPKYSEKSNYLAFAQKCNVKTGGINLEIALYLDESTISRYSNTDCLVQGDVVINSTGGGTMGRVGYFECEIPKGIKGIYPDSHVTTIRTVGFMEQKFVFYFLKTKQKELESLGEGSTNQTELKPYTLQNLLLPLPPLAEQKAIVAKIEELLPLCKKLVK